MQKQYPLFLKNGFSLVCLIATICTYAEPLLILVVLSPSPANLVAHILKFPTEIPLPSYTWKIFARTVCYFDVEFDSWCHFPNLRWIYWLAHYVWNFARFLPHHTQILLGSCWNMRVINIIVVFRYRKRLSGLQFILLVVCVPPHDEDTVFASHDLDFFSVAHEMTNKMMRKPRQFCLKSLLFSLFSRMSEFFTFLLEVCRCGQERPFLDVTMVLNHRRKATADRETEIEATWESPTMGTHESLF
jgi:hypothetical protein